MKVNPNRDLSTAAKISRATKRSAQPVSGNAVDLHASNKLALKLAATPAVRAEKVARAKALISDPNYPAAKTIRAVARQLVEDLRPLAPSEEQRDA